MHGLVFLSVVPSPYQRDVFSSIAERGNITIRVHYLEHAAPDSPWPATEIASWEQVLPGITFGRGIWRSHVNWKVPRPQPGETWVVNGAMTDVTTQLLMRRLGSRSRWFFWGELPSRPRSGWKRWIQSRQYAPLRRAHGIVAVGTRARDAYRSLLPGMRLFNQPYACRLDAFTRAARVRTARDRPVFLFCGQMVARKGIDVLLDAFSQVVIHGAPATLELLGREAELPRYLSAVDPSVRKHIVYVGFKPPAELPEHFARADVFVLPSRHDGWGVVVNQAIGAGLPIICSDAVGAALDLVHDRVNGTLVPAGDVSALAAAMRDLATSPELRQSYGSASAKSAEALSPERAAAFWEQLAGDR